MGGHATVSESLCYSARFIQPFISLLRGYPEYPKLAFARLESVSFDERVPLSVGHECITNAINGICDPDIGLKAGRLTHLGSGGILDYVMQSAATVREGHEVAIKYAQLYNDALQPIVYTDSKRALVRFNHKVKWIRPAADFTMSTWYVNHLRKQLWYDSSVECWFAHPKPQDIYEYERTFGLAKLRFQAPCYGFSFNAEYLEAPCTGADAKTHIMLRTQLEVAFDDLPEVRFPIANVRQLLAKEISRGYFTTDSVAQHIHMTHCTLVRRLEKRGTGLSRELDELTRLLAIRYVRNDVLSLGEVEFLLGFPNPPAFQRAFKRWTGQTPLQYRNTQ